MKGSKEVLRGVKKQGLYTLEAEVASGSVDAASTKPLSNTVSNQTDNINNKFNQSIYTTQCTTQSKLKA